MNIRGTRVWISGVLGYGYEGARRIVTSEERRGEESDVRGEKRRG